MHLAVAYVQQGVWLGRGFVEPAAAVVESSASLPVATAGTGSDHAATAESAEQPLSGWWAAGEQKKNLVNHILHLL